MRKIIFKRWSDPLAGLPTRKGRKPNNAVRLLVGPEGVSPANPDTFIGRQYKLWMGHTNFSITPAVAENIEQVPGVEVFRVFSRYRFWLGVGRVFDSTEVKAAIRRELCDGPSTLAVEALSKALRSRYEHWAIAVSFEGQLEALTGPEEVVRRAANIKQRSASRVVTSWGPK